jgi:hypothetical protein
VTLVVNPTINATAGAHGAIVPSGTVAVPYGGSTNFVVTADTGCWISSVETNGVAVPAAAGSQIYTSQWQNVTASGSITATFVVRRFGGGDNDGYDNGSASNLSILSTMPRGTVYKLR